VTASGWPWKSGSSDGKWASMSWNRGSKDAEWIKTCQESTSIRIGHVLDTGIVIHHLTQNIFHFNAKLCHFRFLFPLLDPFFRIIFTISPYPSFLPVFSSTHVSMTWYQPTGRNQTLDRNHTMSWDQMGICTEIHKSPNNGKIYFHLKC